MTWNTCVTDNHEYAPFVVVTAQFFPQSWLISGFLTRIKQRGNTRRLWPSSLQVLMEYVLLNL